MQANKKFVHALILSITLHAVLLLFIAQHYQAAPAKIAKKSANKNVNPVIKSYLFKAPQKNTENTTASLPRLATSEPDPSVTVALEPLKPLVPNTAPVEPLTETTPIKPNNNVPEVAAAEPVVSTPLAINKKSSNRSKVTFNPYQGVSKLVEQQEQAWIQEEIAKAQAQRGHSIMQTQPEAVPQRKVELSQEQKRKQNATVVGNETITKQNGVCTQTTDLSFIDDGLGKVTSYSACGETNAERYFREFMSKRLAKYKK